MPRPETSIWRALKARVGTLVLSPVLEVSYPNESFTPPEINGEPLDYLKVSHFPNTVSVASLGVNGTNRHLGILQITLMTKQDQTLSVATEIAWQIAGHFKVGTTMTDGDVLVRIERPPVVSSLLVDGKQPLAEMPITIRYQADLSRP